MATKVVVSYVETNKQRHGKVSDKSVLASKKAEISQQEQDE